MLPAPRLLVLVIVAIATSRANAQAPAVAEAPLEVSPVAADSEATVRGRQAFLRGLELSRKEQYGEALNAFREAAASRDAAIVQFNIGYCQRALGDYTAARETFFGVLQEAAGLSQDKLAEAAGYLRELESLVVRVSIAVLPHGGELAVDGRGFAASRAEPGARIHSTRTRSERLGSGRHTLILNPGDHVFRAIRPGYADAVVQKDLRIGQRIAIDLNLELLPAILRVSSTPSKARVLFNGKDVGISPIALERPAGRYNLQLTLAGYEPYLANVDLASGQEATLTGRLALQKPSILSQWWFWTASAVVLGAVGFGTYAYLRSQDEAPPPPYDDGNTNWLIRP